MSNLDLSRIDAAQRIYDSQIPEEAEIDEYDEMREVSFGNWVPRREITDEEVDQFIAEFAERGFYVDEVGDKQTESLYCAVAKQYARGSVGGEVGPILFRWAKACVSLGCWF